MKQKTKNKSSQKVTVTEKKTKKAIIMLDITKRLLIAILNHFMVGGMQHTAHSVTNRIEYIYANCVYGILFLHIACSDKLCNKNTHNNFGKEQVLSQAIFCLFLSSSSSSSLCGEIHNQCRKILQFVIYTLY